MLKFNKSSNNSDFFYPFSSNSLNLFLSGTGFNNSVFNASIVKKSSNNDD